MPESDKETEVAKIQDLLLTRLKTTYSIQGELANTYKRGDDIIETPQAKGIASASGKLLRSMRSLELAGIDTVDNASRLTAKVISSTKSIGSIKIKTNPKLGELREREKSIIVREERVFVEEEEWQLAKRKLQKERLAAALTTLQMLEDQRRGPKPKPKPISRRLKYTRDDFCSIFEKVLDVSEIALQSDEKAQAEIDKCVDNLEVVMDFVKDQYISKRNSETTSEMDDEFEQLAEEVDAMCTKMDLFLECLDKNSENGHILELEVGIDSERKHGENGSGDCVAIPLVLHRGPLKDCLNLGDLIPGVNDIEVRKTIKKLTTEFAAVGLPHPTLTIQHGEFVATIKTKDTVGTPKNGLNENEVIGIGFGKTALESLDDGVSKTYNEFFLAPAPTYQKGELKKCMNGIHAGLKVNTKRLNSK